MEYTQIIHNDLMNKKLYCHSTVWEGNYGDMAINVALKHVCFSSTFLSTAGILALFHQK